MTLPLVLALHLAYGALMAYATERRMRAEGEVLGWPLVATLTPVALVSAPVVALLTRYLPHYFLQGVPFSSWEGAWERYHLALMFGAAASTFVFTLVGNFIAIASLARDVRKPALIPFAAAAATVVAVFVVDGRSVLEVSAGSPVHTHPAGLLSLAVLACLGAAYTFARARLARPVQRTE